MDAAISANPPRDADDDHPFRPVRAWDPVAARRWLTFLAQHMTTTGSRDLAWWHLHRVVPRTASVVAGLVAGLVFGLVVACTRNLTVAHVIGLTFGLDMAIVSGGSMVTDQLVAGLAFGVVSVALIAFVVVLATRRAPMDRPWRGWRPGWRSG